MAKKKKKGQILASVHGTKSIGVAPKEKDRKDRDRSQQDWVLYYKESNNSFPNDLADKILKSGTNSGIINSKKTLTVGNGLKYSKDGEDLTLTGSDLEFTESINLMDETFEELYEKEALSYIGWGAAYVRGVRDSVGNVHYFPVDPTKVRLGFFNENMIIEKAFISPDWQRIRNLLPDSEQKDRMVEIEMFNGTDTQEEFLIMERRMFPGLDYYGVPDYMASILSGWVDINYRIGKFNIDDLDNGMFPSMLLQMFGEPPQGQDPEEFMKDIVAKFTGEGNNGKIVGQLLDNPEQAANIEILDRVQQGHFETLDKMSDQQLVTAHGWYRSLTGLAEPGSLGSNQQIKNEFDLAMNMKVIPDYRRPLNRFFNKLLRIADKDFQVGVINLRPLSLANDVDVNKVLIVDEGREVLGFEPHKDTITGAQLIDLEDREDDDTTSSGNSSGAN